MATQVRLTYREYEALPADGRRYELHEGDLSVTPAPSTRHQRAVGKLFIGLHQHVEAHGMGEVFVSPVDCILSETTIVQPDIVFVDSGRLSAVSARGIEGAPTLVVEVISPSTTVIDRSVKFLLYARHGVPYYWMVDLDARIIEAHVLRGGVYELEGRLGGPGAIALPPLLDLRFEPAVIWA